MSLRLSASWRRASPLLGIDLGAGQARLLACAGSRRSWKVSHCLSRPWPPDALEDARPRQFDTLASLLRDLARGLGRGRPQVALALPDEACRRACVAVPAGLRPWRCHAWLSAQAERVGQAPADVLVFHAQLLPGWPLAVLLTVCARELVEDWQGLVEAAGLDLVLLDDRPRVMRQTLSALGPGAAAGQDVVVAEALGERCRLHAWAPGQPPRLQDLPLDDGQDCGAETGTGAARPASRWLIATEAQLPPWSARLQARDGAAWRTPDLRGRLRWPPGVEPPDADCFLAALGLALRQWQD